MPRVLRLLLVIAVVLSSAVLAQAPRVLTVGSQNDGNSLDPSNLGPMETDISYKIYSSLIRRVPGTLDEYVGDLAESWEASPDGLTYTFHLRRGVQWQRGYGEVTAEDVKFSFERLKDPELASELLSEAERIAEIRVPDPYTVEIELAAPWPDFFVQFLTYRGGFIVNEQALEDFGATYTANAVGSGAYTLTTWSPREQVVLERNPDYYGEQPYFDVIRYAIILEESVMEVALERGEIDIFYAADPIVALSLLENPNIKTERFVAERMFTLYFNTERPPFDDVRVRRAFWYALDKEELVEVGFQGLARPSDTLLGAHVPGNLQESPYTYDPEQALALLEEAGFDFNKTYLFPMDDRSVLVSPIMQAQWARIGIRTDTPMFERLQHLDEMEAGRFDIGVRTVSRNTADQVFTWYLEESNIPYPAASRYRNPELQDLLNRLRVAPDPEQATNLAHEIQRLVHAEAPVIPLAQVEWVLAMRNDIEGAHPGVFRITHETIRRTE